jgi:pyruvate dehydrogenase E1 component alpha subunit
MLRIRMVEEEIARRYPEQAMRCPVHLSIGQEASAAAVGMALAPSDQALSTHRAHAHYLGKGGDLNAMIAELYGKASGCCGGRGGSMHLSDARAIFLGDGATEEGVFYEAANFAALRQLPVLFVCENNLYSVYSPLSKRQPATRSLCQVAQALGLSARQLDGNDALAVFDAAVTAVAGLRAGSGPVFLECMTYRWREHCGPDFDDQLAYRPVGELAAWQARDPLTLLVQRLELPAARIAAMRSEIGAEIALAFTAAEAAPYPQESTVFDGIYSMELAQ